MPGKWGGRAPGAPPPRSANDYADLTLSAAYATGIGMIDLYDTVSPVRQLVSFVYQIDLCTANNCQMYVPYLKMRQYLLLKSTL